MSTKTKIYRVYCYDAAQHNVFTDEIEAASDAEAIARAEALEFGTKCELWQGKRLVATLEAERRTG